MAEYAEDTTGQGALPDEASSDAEGVRSDEVAVKVGDLTLDELLEQLTTAPKFYDTVKGHVQRETRSVREAVQQLSTGDHVSKADYEALVTYVASWEDDRARLRYLAKQNLDPETEAQLLKDAERESRLARLEMERRRPAKAETKQEPDQWQNAMQAEFQEWGGPDIDEYAKGKGVSYERVFDAMTTQKLWPVRKQGQTPAGYVRDMVRAAQAQADKMAADLKKREAAPVRAGADSRGGGANAAPVTVGTLATMTNPTDIQKALDQLYSKRR